MPSEMDDPWGALPDPGGRLPPNPPAFPVGGQTERGDRGMDLRDYFAAQALTAVADRLVPFKADHLASRSYEIADAMLRHRTQPRPRTAPGE